MNCALLKSAVLSLAILLASTIWCGAAEPPVPPPSTFAPLTRTFTATAYTFEGVESAHSEPLTTTLRFPLTPSWDASPSPNAAGYLVYMTSLNRTWVYDAGTNTSITIAPTNIPSPPLNLRLLIPEQSVQLGSPTEPQRYFRSAVLMSTNLNGTNWQVFKDLQQAVQK